MSEVLRGRVTGASLALIEVKARSMGTSYFGTDCQLVQIFDAIAKDDGSFTADFATQVHHRVEHRAYGPGVCKGCKRDSWPHRKLTTAAPVAPPALGGEHNE